MLEIIFPKKNIINFLNLRPKIKKRTFIGLLSSHWPIFSNLSGLRSGFYRCGFFVIESDFSTIIIITFTAKILNVSLHDLTDFFSFLFPMVRFFAVQ